MAEHMRSTHQRHKLLTYAKLTLIGFFALAAVALAVGLCGIHMFREHAELRTSESTQMIMKDLEGYAIIDDQISSETSFSGAYVQYIFDSTAARVNMALYLVDSTGKCIVSSDNSGIAPSNVKVPSSVLKELEAKGEFSSETKGKLNPAEKRPLMCSGYRFTVIEGDGSDSVYYVISNAFTDDIDAFIKATLITGVVSVIVMLTAFVVFQCFYSKSYKNPEATLAKVLRVYAQGDYSETLDPEDFSSPVYRDIIQSLNQNVANLKSISQQQAEFVSNVSHELRTPMTIISGYVDGILDGTVPKNKRTEYLYIVSQEMQRLKILVSSMLNLTKFDNGTIQIKHENFAINDLIFRTILMFENRLEKRNIEVEGLDSDTVTVYGDRDLIGQVVYNLTENAVKFVDTGGTIAIRLEETKDESIFAIRNTGSGIPKDELPKIFGRFYKSDFSRSQDKTGLGLGLDIIRKILRLHNAQISVSSEENVFTEFTVSFPKKPDTHNYEA